MPYKTDTIDALNTMCEEISEQLEKAEKLLIEIENDDDVKDMQRSATEALVVVQDILYDLR